jgi:hypothetical protein
MQKQSKLAARCRHSSDDFIPAVIGWFKFFTGHRAKAGKCKRDFLIFYGKVASFHSIRKPTDSES